MSKKWNVWGVQFLILEIINYFPISGDSKQNKFPPTKRACSTTTLRLCVCFPLPILLRSNPFATFLSLHEQVFLPLYIFLKLAVFLTSHAYILIFSCRKAFQAKLLCFQTNSHSYSSFGIYFYIYNLYVKSHPYI